MSEYYFSDSTLNGLLFVALAKHVFTWICAADSRTSGRQDERRDDERGNGETRPVATVKSLTIYPVKSMGGIEVESALCTPQGLRMLDSEIRDRFCIVTNRKRVFQTMRTLPQLGLIATVVRDGELFLRGPDGSEVPVEVDHDAPTEKIVCFRDPVEARKCTAKVNDWLDLQLGKTGLTLHATRVGLALTKLTESRCKQFMQSAGPQDEIAFPDNTPYMIMSQSSLNFVQARIAAPLDKDNFRPNIMIAGSEPFAEESWRKFQIGEVCMEFTMPCGRCVLTKVRDGKVRSDGEPLKTLFKIRPTVTVDGKTSPVLGVHTILKRGGVIRLGDEVMAC